MNYKLTSMKLQKYEKTKNSMKYKFYTQQTLNVSY